MQKPIKFPPRPVAGGTVPLMGLEIFGGSRRDAETLLSRALKSGGAHPFLVFTPNLEMLSRAKHDPEIRAVLSSADLLLPDGVGVRILSRFRVRERIPGIEIGEFLLSKAARYGLPVYLLGGHSGVAARAALRLKERFPTLPVVGTHHGYFTKEEEAALVKEIRQSGAALLLVCTGFPRQEDFLVRNRDALSPVRVAAGLGGALDVYAGDVRRAPLWMQSCGLEWLYRVLCEPVRLGRLLRSVVDLLR